MMAFVNQGWFARCDVCHEADDAAIAQRSLRLVKESVEDKRWFQFSGKTVAETYHVCRGCASTWKEARQLLSETRHNADL
jgi:hypothetical protein